MKKLWANLTAVFMGLTMIAGCNQGDGDDSSTPPAHTCAFTRQLVDDEYLKSEATCTEAAQYYYACATATCDEKGEEFYSIGDPYGHRGGTATVTQKAICEVCNQPYGETLPADGQGDKCTNHVFNQQKVDNAYKISDATCESPAVYYCSCECGFSDRTETTPTFTYGNPLAHTFNKQVETADYKASDATCVSAATYYYSCECGAKGTTTFVATNADDAATGAHTFNQKLATSEYKASDATCGEAATYYYSCVCGAKDTTTFEVGTAGHTFDKKVTNETYLKDPATCTKKATYWYSCECGVASTERYFEDGEPLAHTYDKELAEPAYLKTAAETCDGTSVYYKSCTCGASSEGTDVEATFDVPNSGHKYDKEVVSEDTKASDASCSAPATYYYSCVCGEKSTTETFTDGESLGHTWENKVEETYKVSDANCQLEAVYYKSCSVCGVAGSETFNDGAPNDAHVFEERVVAGAFKNPATCTSAATYWKSCVCGETSSETFTDGEPLAHTYDKELAEPAYLKTAAETCDGTSVYYKSCTCGASSEGTDVEATFDVPNSGHKYDKEVVSEDTKASDASCSAPATYYYSCDCGDKSTTDTFTDGEPLAHAWVNEVEETYKVSDANCQSAAIYYKSCSACGATGSETFTDGEPTTTHNYVEEVAMPIYLASAATCTSVATYYKSCSVCGANSKGTAEEATFVSGTTAPHVYNQQKVEDTYKANDATCVSAATYYVSCGKCNASSQGTAGEATFADPNGEPTAIHDYVEEVAMPIYLASAATCTSAATYYKSCSMCGLASTTETFVSGEQGAHTYDNKSPETKYLKDEATCTSGAVYYISCSVCDASSEGTDGEDTFVSGEGTGHDFTAETKTEDYNVCDASCLTAATYYYSCSKCGEKGTTTFTDGTTSAHNYINKVAEEGYKASAATCTAKATYYYSCSVCGLASTAKEDTFESGEMLKHVFNQEKAEQTYLKDAATCTSGAIYYKSCECGLASTTATFEDGTGSGHTVEEKVDPAYLASEATCTSVATYYKSCSECNEAVDETFESGTVNAHVYDQEKRTSAYFATEATCSAPKSYYKSCVCGASSKGTAEEETFVSGSNGTHIFVKEIIDSAYLATEATCVAYPTYYKACSACGMAGTQDIFEDNTANLPDHSGGVATCMAQAMCTTCSTPYGNTLAHTFTREVAVSTHLKEAATCGAKAQYWKTCDTCGVTDAGDDASYDQNAYFTAGESTGKHSGGTATQSAQAICENCNQPYGDTLLSALSSVSVTSGYTRYDLSSALSNTTEGFGTQFDTVILESQNGLTDEEWQIQVNAMKEMNLQNIRVRFYPEAYLPATQEEFEETANDRGYRWESIEMLYLYTLLDACMEVGTKVDLSWYGNRTTFRSEDGLIKGSWMADTTSEFNSATHWVTAPTDNADFAVAVTDCLAYLINEKGYTCINEYSLFPEPEGVPNLAWPSDYNTIASSIDGWLKDITYTKDSSKNLDDMLKFSGPATMEIANEKNYTATESSWGTTASSYDTTVGQISTNLEKLTSSVYPFDNTTSNAQMLKTAQAYVAVATKYKMTWGMAEFGTKNSLGSVDNSDIETYDRAMFTARFFINMVNGGCTNMKHFVFSNCNYDNTLNNLGLINFREDDFSPKPVWFTWSLICRYTDIGSTVFPVTSSDADVCITALKLPDGSWTYVIANNSATAKNVAIVNGREDRAREMNMYVVTESVAGGTSSADLKVVTAKDSVSTVNGAAEFTVPKNGVVVLSNKA